MGEKNRALKAAVRQRMAETGEPYRAAIEAVKAEHQDGANDTLFVVDYPKPQLAGAAPCPDCHASGLGPNRYEQRTDSGIVLVLDTACPTCLGCGRAEHESRCLPGDHATDDLDEISDYQELLDYDAEQRGEEPEERCFSCQGRRFWWSQAVDGEAAEQGLTELQKLVKARGLEMDQVQAAGAWGELDDLLGEGAQRLFHQGLEHVRMPCGCTEGEGRRLTRAEFEAEQDAAEVVPAPRDGGAAGDGVHEVEVGDRLFRFTGCPAAITSFGPPQGGDEEEPGNIVMRERPDEPGVLDGFAREGRPGRVVTYRWVASGTAEGVLPQVLGALTGRWVEQVGDVEGLYQAAPEPEPVDRQVREKRYEGGPFDGRRTEESLAFVVGQQEMPTNGGGIIGAWHGAWPPDDQPRYMPVQDSPRSLRMVWATPSEPGAPRAYERPEPLDDFGDHD
ncbi:hypothetical protein [Streptomyces sp. NRRL S-350]|uniref:hypothetical protein n=1 Tax=Streptomyces sp. NRRL S-350 TaxID=1463902 RepID=UPI000A8385B8|nr:hypothetical protein [Streptomyces sp. NRRL S-350]